MYGNTTHVTRIAPSKWAHEPTLKQMSSITIVMGMMVVLSQLQ